MTELRSPSGRRRPDGAALGIAAALAIVSGVIFWNTSQIGGAAAYARIGPTAFPYAIATALLLLSIGTAVKAWQGKFPEREHDEPAPILWIVGGLLAQLLLLKVAGFSIATGILFAATAKGLGRGPLWLTLPIGIALSLAIWLIFAGLLQLSLPAGPLEHLFR
jgi:putative tricarboxylic transport membrane protein